MTEPVRGYGSPIEDPLAEIDTLPDNSGPESVKHGGPRRTPAQFVPPNAQTAPPTGGISVPQRTVRPAPPTEQPSHRVTPRAAPGVQDSKPKALTEDENAILREMEVLPPEIGWQGALYKTLKIRTKPSEQEIKLRAQRAKVIAKDRIDWRRINRPRERASGYCGFLSVVSEKGGVGKTTVSVLLSYVLAEIRKDPVAVADLNPDRGSLPRRFGVSPATNIRDLVTAADDIPNRRHVHEFMAKVPGANVSVLSGDTDPKRRDKTTENDVRVVADLFKPYFNIGVLDNGTGISHSALRGSLSVSHGLALVIDNTDDAYDFVEGTLKYLQDNGYEDLRKRVVLVVIDKVPNPNIKVNAKAISSTPGLYTEVGRHADVTAISLRNHFKEHVRKTVIIPFDPALSKAGPIAFDLLRESTIRSVRELAASLMDDLVE